MDKIEIWEPRYRDGVVLIAHYNIKPGLNLIHFTKAQLADMVISYQAIKNCPVEMIKSRSGRQIMMYAVPMFKLQAVKDKQLTIC